MPRVGAHNPINVKCRNGHEFPTTVRREGTKCPECTVTVYVRKDGTVGYLRGNTTDPTPGRTDVKKTTIPKAKVAPSGRRPARSHPDSVRATPATPAKDPAGTEPVQRGGDDRGQHGDDTVRTADNPTGTVQPAGGKRGGRKPPRTPYGHVY